MLLGNLALGHDWIVRKDFSERVLLAGVVLEERGIKFVDLDPEKAKSQDGAKDKVSLVQDSTLGEAQVASLPVSPSQVKVR